MTTPKITIVIEVHEASGQPVHAIVGSSGKVYGHATKDAKTGRMCMRMSLEEWRGAKKDICLSRHRYYPLLWDIEIEERPVEAESKAESPEKPAPAKRAATRKK